MDRWILISRLYKSPLFISALVDNCSTVKWIQERLADCIVLLDIAEIEPPNPDLILQLLDLANQTCNSNCASCNLFRADITALVPKRQKSTRRHLAENHYSNED